MDVIKSISDEAQATKSTPHMTEFGRTLYSMMLTRGIERRKDLAEALNESGYAISQAGLSYYMNGQRNVEPAFVVHVSDLLKLTKKERQELAWVFTYGQS